MPEEGDSLEDTLPLPTWPGPRPDTTPGMGAEPSHIGSEEPERRKPTKAQVKMVDGSLFTLTDVNSYRDVVSAMKQGLPTLTVTVKEEVYEVTIAVRNISYLTPVW